MVCDIKPPTKVLLACSDQSTHLKGTYYDRNHEPARVVNVDFG